MNKKLILAFILFTFFFCQSEIISQGKGRSVIIERVSVNGLTLPANENKEIIIDENDSVEIDFRLEAGGNNQPNFVFSVSVSDFKDTLTTKVSRAPIRYSKLKEGRYFVEIKAFDGLRQWETAPVRFEIYSSISLKGMQKKINAARKETLAKEIELKKKDAELQKALEESGGTSFISVVYGVVGTLLILVIILFIYNATSTKSKKSGNSLLGLKIGGGGMSESEVKRLTDENYNLRKELESLRNQIDILQMRAEELNDRNNELEESVNRLSKSKEELENLQVQKDELFAVIIHDIKNPAALIKSLVELLRSYDLTASEQQDIMNDILTTTSKIVSLSHEVSRVLALEGGKMRLDIERNDPSDVARDVFTRNQIKARNKEITLSIEIDPNIQEAEFDSHKIDEVLDNLISNAIKFTNDGGFIKLNVLMENDSIVFEISDTGQGLSEEDIKNAFQRGAQLSAKPTKGESSTGLGLWIVKKLVEAHKGRVWVRSTVGKGSTFSFSIPVNSRTEGFAEVDMSN